jgi:hypothetical protein
LDAAFMPTRVISMEFLIEKVAVKIQSIQKLPLLRLRHLKGEVMQNMYFYIAYNQSADKNPPHPRKIIV